MVTLALYKKPGRWTNRVISWRTCSPYSHCELVVNGLCYSASGRDGGVRSKEIDLTDGWDLVDLPWAKDDEVLRLFGVSDSCGYDYVGTILGGGLGIKMQSDTRWMCSEWCAAGLGLSEPWRFTPASLGAAVYPWRQIPV